MFVKTRSTVGPHLYEDVLPCINWLRDLNIPCAVVTNGNANLSLCPTLGPQLLTSINAPLLGTMKPSPVPFLAISQITGVPANRIVFIGDSLEADVKGSMNAGMIPVLINRKSTIDPAFAFPALDADTKLSSSAKYIEINSLYPDELGSALYRHLKEVI